MSIAWMNEVWANSQHKGGTLLLHLALADNANDATNECWPGVKYLAAKTRMSEQGVRNALKVLEEAGDLEIEARHTPKGRQTTNIYRLKPLGGKIKSENIQGEGQDSGGEGQDSGGSGVNSVIPPEPSYEPSKDPSNNNGHPQPFEVAPPDNCQRLIAAFQEETALFIQGHLYDSHWREPCERLLAKSKSYEEAVARMRHGIEVARGNNPQGKTYALASPRSIMAAAMSYDPSGPKKPQPKKARGRPRYIPAEERETQIL